MRLVRMMKQFRIETKNYRKACREMEERAAIEDSKGSDRESLREMNRLTKKLDHILSRKIVDSR